MNLEKQPSKELKSLFQELVAIGVSQHNRRDWAIITWKKCTPFSLFSLKDLMSK